MPTGGFYAEVTLGYDGSIAQEKGGRPFGMDSLRAIQLSKREVLDVLAKGGADFTTAEWREVLLGSVGFEPGGLTERPKMRCCCGWCPSSSATTTWLNWGLAAPASHTCSSRCRPMLVGNFEVDVEHRQRIGHLFGPLPPEMRDDIAFMDRIHAFLPGWDVPKLNPRLFTEHFGLVSDFLTECFTQLREQSRVSTLQGRVFWGGALSGRDLNGVNKTVSGLLKLIYPDANAQVSDEDLEWVVRLALEVRRRVKEQQKRIGAAEFRNTHFSDTMGAEGVEKFVSTPELQSQGGIGDEPLECGQVWTLSPGGQDEHSGLFRLEVTEGPGSGVRVLNNPVPAAFKESIRCAEQNLYARAQQLVGDRDPRAHEFSVQLRGFDAAKSGAKTGVASLIALASALLRKSVRGGLVVVGEVTLGGTIEPVHNAVTLAEQAIEKGAKSLLLPVACRRQLFELSDEMATKLDIEFYRDGRDALLKALAD